MRHAKRSSRLGRKPAHRHSMVKNLVVSLVEHGRIETTLARAKYLRTVIEPLITLGKRGDLHARRLVLARTSNKEITHKIFDVIAPVYANRNGGYTRILKTGIRRGDNAETAIIELVDFYEQHKNDHKHDGHDHEHNHDHAHDHNHEHNHSHA